MANKRKEHFRRTKKSRMRELKHSRSGWCGMIFALAALALFVCSVVWSFLVSGEATIVIGEVSLVALVFAVGAFALGLISIREPKVRPIPPRTGLALGAVMSVVLGGLYVYGMF